MKPRVFIGSSTESIDYARAAQQNLQDDAEVTVWDQGLFGPSKFILESLVEKLPNFDFGLFVFSPDDIVRIRGKQLKSARDNVVFELGLFIGRLGRLNTFVLVPNGTKSLRLPSDLSGMIYLGYEQNRSDGNLIAAMSTACNSIRSRLREYIAPSVCAPRDGSALSEIHASALQIYNGFYTCQPKIEILNHLYEFNIDTKGNCACREERTYMVQEHELALDLLGISGDVPLESFEAAEISVNSHDSGRQIVLLPAYNNQNQKKFLLFFLPPLLSGEKVEFSLSWRWPGMWKSLVEGKSDYWRGRPNASAAVKRLEFRFAVPKSIPRLSVNNSGKGVRTIAATRKRAGAKISEYRLVIEDLKPGEQYLIELRSAGEKKVRTL
ncbi:MAG: TIR domain-containing protein [Thermoanaerobaculia bacterium]